jgi:predicted DNA-binding transcriptional regulator AlpA
MLHQGETRLLNTAEAAQMLGVSQSFLEKDRWRGARIPFIKIGARAVRYAPEALQAFIEQSAHRSTTEYGAS